MRTLLCLIFLFSRHSYSQDCLETVDILQEKLQLMNEKFDSNVVISWTNDDGDELESYFDASMKTEDTIVIKNPCVESEENVSLETQIFILAHEFSHTIIDTILYITNEELEFMETIPEAELDLYFELHHLNTDILAMKILNFFGINTRIAVQDMMNKDPYKERYKVKRYYYLINNLSSNFQNGNDFIPVLYFGGMLKISLAAAEGSSIIGDIRDGAYIDAPNYVVYRNNSALSDYSKLITH